MGENVLGKITNYLNHVESFGVSNRIFKKSGYTLSKKDLPRRYL